MKQRAGHLRPEDLAAIPPRRPSGGAVIEMHAHSSDMSLDSGVSAKSIAEQALLRGLDGVVLTEHNALWQPERLVALSEQAEIRVMAGIELGTDAGHVLVYGLEQYRPELLILERLRRIVEYEGAAMVLAHPMRPFHRPRPAADTYASWFDGVETINGDHSDSEHGYLVREAEMLRLASVGGSDAHSRQAVGRVATAFTRPIRTVSDIVEQLRRRQCFAVDFRG